MEQFHNQLKLVFEVASGSKVIVSKSSPGSAVDFRAMNIGFYSKRESKSVL
jgi:hypothetical protein